MNVVFADSGYWIALWSRRDRLHSAAAALAEQLAGSPAVAPDTHTHDHTDRTFIHIQ